MARYLWLNWSGGGNLPPSLGIARALTERGHSVTFAGRPEMVPRVEAAGFRAIEFKQAYAQVRPLSARKPADQGRLLSDLAGGGGRSTIDRRRRGAGYRHHRCHVSRCFGRCADVRPADRHRLPHFRLPATRPLAADDRTSQRHAPTGRLWQPAAPRCVVAIDRPYHRDRRRGVRCRPGSRAGAMCAMSGRCWKTKKWPFPRRCLGLLTIQRRWY